MNNSVNDLYNSIHETRTLISEEYTQRNEIDQIIRNLTIDLRGQYPQEIHQDRVSDIKERQSILMTKIENIVCNLVKDIAENKKPVSIVVQRKSWSNCVFNSKLYMKPSENCTKTEIKLCGRNSLPKFSLICFLLGKIYILLKTQETCTKRELYYRNIEVLNSQSSIDSALNEISCLLEAPLYDLNVHTTSKGLIFGPIILKTISEETDCSSVGGTLIPANVSDVIEIKSEAKFVILIEKDTIFQRLLDDEAMKNLPSCIFVTAKGCPDINTRTLLKKIWDILSIPILALVDPDPWGIEIMCIYRFGSLAMSHQGDQLAVPSVRWLGVFPSEAGALSSVRAELGPRDRAKITDLLRRPYTAAAPRLTQELQSMVFKAEIESIDVPEGYLANKYIPCKIAAGDFI